MGRDHGPQRPTNDLGEFSTDSFEDINCHPGQGFESGGPRRVMGSSDMPPAGEPDGDAAIRKVGGLSRARVDKTKGAAVKIPTEAGGPLPQR